MKVFGEKFREKNCGRKAQEGRSCTFLKSVKTPSKFDNTFSAGSPVPFKRAMWRMEIQTCYFCPEILFPQDADGYPLLWWCISSIARGRRGYPEYPWSANVSGRGRDINHNSIIWSSQPGQFMAPYGGPYSPWYGDLYGSIHGQWSTASLAILRQGLQLLFSTIILK